MKKLLIIVIFSLSGTIDAGSDKLPKFISLLGSHPPIATRTFEWETPATLFDNKNLVTEIYFVGCEDQEAAQQILSKISIKNNRAKEPTNGKLAPIRSDYIGGLPAESLVRPVRLFLAYLFLRSDVTSRSMNNVDYWVFESSGTYEIECARQIDVSKPRPATYHMFGDSVDAIGSPFLESEHLALLFNRIKSGEAVGKSILTVAITDFLENHSAFGLEIDHRELQTHFVARLRNSETIKAKL